MLETPHVALGAAIATKVHPALAIPLSLGSHFILDKIPHWNPHLYTETKKLGHPSNFSTYFALVDSVTALGLGMYIASRYISEPPKALLVLACCFSSVLSDVIKIPYYYFAKRWGWLVKWVHIERNMQENAAPIPGMLTQLVVIGASLWWIWS